MGNSKSKKVDIPTTISIDIDPKVQEDFKTFYPPSESKNFKHKPKLNIVTLSDWKKHLRHIKEREESEEREQRNQWIPSAPPLEESTDETTALPPPVYSV